MPLQIANPVVVHKVERLARVTGLNKTAAVERAVDQLLRDVDSRPPASASGAQDRLAALLAQMDRIPDLPQAGEALGWDDLGLPA